jgi:hypothetical protein
MLLMLLKWFNQMKIQGNLFFIIGNLFLKLLILKKLEWINKMFKSNKINNDRA